MFTVISIGYGDILTYSYEEKTLDLFCIMFGVLVFQFLASFIENFIIASSCFESDLIELKHL